MPADLSQLLPILQEKWEIFRENVKNSAGCDIFPYCGYRSPEEQERLYAQGRTKPGKIVTNAKPGQSKHEKRAAIDFAFVVPKGQDIYGPFRRPAVQRAIIQAADKAGLISGGLFQRLKDWPHIELHRKDIP